MFLEMPGNVLVAMCLRSHGEKGEGVWSLGVLFYPFTALRHKQLVINQMGLFCTGCLIT